MKKLALVIVGTLLVTACAYSTPRTPRGEVESYCRNYARTATFDGTPDEESYYRTCTHIKRYQQEQAPPAL